MRVRLKERRLDATEVMSFVFDLGGQPFEYRPGQFVYCELDALDFPDERGNRRHFTLASSPTEEGIVMFTTRMRGTGYKETLRHAPFGCEVSLGAPLGRFVMPEGEIRRHVFIAGGIGITPYRSILRYAMDAKKPIDAVLLYFSHSSADIVFRQELEGISRHADVLVSSCPEQPRGGLEGRTGQTG